MGISLRAVRNAYHSERTSIRKASGEVYNLDWKELVYLKDPRECYHCGKALTVKEKSTWFYMEREDIKKDPVTFTSLYVALKVTGISECALRNACERTNKKVTRRKDGFARYEIEWYGICCQCNPSLPKESRSVIESYIIPKWDINELFP